MHALAAQLTTLRAQRSTLTDLAQAAALDALVGVAISGNVHGDIQTGGQRYQALLQVCFQIEYTCSHNSIRRGICHD